MRYQNLAGADPNFIASLERLVAESPYANDITVFSGKRSLEHQKELFDQSDRTGHSVAFPTPHAPHVRGVAADLGWRGGSFKSMPAEVQKYLHTNALRYGLSFPMSYEPWHIQMAGDGLSGGGGGDSLVGGIREGSLGREDTLGEDTMQAPKPMKFDPLPQTSGYFDPVAAAGHDSLSPSAPNRGMVASALRAPSRGLFANGGLFHGGILTGSRPKPAAAQGSFTNAQQQKLEARLGPGWKDASRADQLAVLYPGPKSSTPKAGNISEGTGLNIPANSAEEIARLSTLPPLDYERERARIADEWGVRVQTIDTAVTRFRKDSKSASTPPRTNTKIPVASQEKMLQNARRLVESGTPRNMVEDSLKKLGIDPSLL